MDILGYFAKQMQMQEQLHNDFMEVARNGMMEHQDDFAAFRDDRPEDDKEASSEEAEDSAEESAGYELMTYSPEKRSFDEDEIDANDPKFWGGFAMGLPSSVYINNGFGNPVNSLIPIINGLFRDRG